MGEYVAVQSSLWFHTFPRLRGPVPRSSARAAQQPVHIDVFYSSNLAVQVVVFERINKHMPHTSLGCTLDLKYILPTIHVQKTITKSRASLATGASSPLVVHRRLRNCKEIDVTWTHALTRACTIPPCLAQVFQKTCRFLGAAYPYKILELELQTC